MKGGNKKEREGDLVKEGRRERGILEEEIRRKAK